VKIAYHMSHVGVSLEHQTRVMVMFLVVDGSMASIWYLRPTNPVPMRDDNAMGRTHQYSGHGRPL